MIERDDLVGVGGEEVGDLAEPLGERLGPEGAVDVAQERAGPAVADRDDLRVQRLGEGGGQRAARRPATNAASWAADSSGGQWWVSMSRARTPASSWSVSPPSCSGHTGTTSGADIELWVAAYMTSS